MIKEFEFYHGAVLGKLLHEAKKDLSISLYPTQSNSSYVLNNNIGLFIKYSSKRMSPWRFSLAKEHQDEILQIKNKLNEVFLLLVCGEDGIVTLSFEELKKILNETHEQMEWISVTRGRNTEYKIKGSDGSLNYKVSKKDFPRKILDLPLSNTTKKKHKVFSWFK